MFIDSIVNFSLISIPVTAYIVYAILDLIVTGLRKRKIRIKSVSIKRKILYLVLIPFGLGSLEFVFIGSPIFFGYFVGSLIFGYFTIAYTLFLFIITLAIYEKIKKINSKFQIIFLLICILLFIPRLEFSNLEVLKCQFSLGSQQIGSADTDMGSPLFNLLMPIYSMRSRTSKAMCRHKVAFNTQNSKLCKDSDCFFDLAIKTKNALLCEKVTRVHSTDMEDCYIKIAQSTKNSSLCENIKSLGWRKMCYERLGIDILPISEKHFITCDSCSGCTTKISNASHGTVVQLNSDLYYKGNEECINLKDVEKIIFDCQNHKIVSQKGNGIGINIQGEDTCLNTIRNCMIANFDIGIQLDADNAHYNNLLDNVIEKNNRYGISITCKWLHPPENILKRNRICDNLNQDIFVSCRDKIINESDKYDICGVKGYLNTCDKTPDCKSPYCDTGKGKGCTYKCDEIKDAITDEKYLEKIKEPIKEISAGIKAADAYRKADLLQIMMVLEKYYADKQIYPISEDLEKISDKNCVLYTTIKPIYISDLPLDPKNPEFYYSYKSNGKTYELIARLENLEDENCITQNGVCLYKCKDGKCGIKE